MACGTLNGENERVQGDQIADGGIEEVLRLFRLEEGQDQVVASIMEGRNVLVVMPTGGGKSLCYQLPSLCRAGFAWLSVL